MLVALPLSTNILWMMLLAILTVMTRASVWGWCTHFTSASMKTMSSGSRVIPFKDCTSVLCTSAEGGRLAPRAYLSHMWWLSPASYGPPNIVKTLATEVKSLMSPSFPIGFRLQKRALLALEFMSVHCMAKTIELSPVCLTLAVFGSSSIHCLAIILGLISIYCLSTALGWTPVHCELAALRLSSVHCLITTLRLTSVHCLSKALGLTPIRCVLTSLILSLGLVVGTYGFNPRTNVHLLSTYNPLISIRLLRPCRTLLVGMCSPIY